MPLHHPSFSPHVALWRRLVPEVGQPRVLPDLGVLPVDDPEEDAGVAAGVVLQRRQQPAVRVVPVPVDEGRRRAADLGQPHPGAARLQAAHPPAPHQPGQLRRDGPPHVGHQLEKGGAVAVGSAGGGDARLLHSARICVHMFGEKLYEKKLYSMLYTVVKEFAILTTNPFALPRTRRWLAGRFRL